MFNSPIPASEDPCLELSYPGSRRRQSGVWRSLPRAFPRLEKEAKRGFLSFFLSIGLLYDVNNVLHSVALRPCMCSCSCCYVAMFNSPIPASEDPCLELSYPGSRRRQSGVWRSLPRAFPRLEKEAKRGFLSFFLSIGLLYDVNNVLHSVALRPCMCSCLTHVCCQMSNGHPELGMW